MTEDPLSRRLMSIDALRGFDMFWIIGGSWMFTALHDIFQSPATLWISTQLTHVEWVGFRFWDIIMPLFLFIVGAAMPFSFSKRRERGDSRARILGHALKRFVILFVFGMVAQGNLLSYDLSQLHIFCNTLQAIAVGYLVSSLALLYLPRIGQGVLFGALLLVYWGLLSWVPVPRFGAGQLTPEGNLAIHIDRVLLGPFQDGTHYTWILSGLTFAATVLLGVLAGHLLRSDSAPYRKVFRLFLSGIVCLLGGWGWGWLFPVIKHLWTSSFVLYSGGMCLILLSLFYLVIDVWGLRRWAFGFTVIGVNAIAVYMATRLFDFRVLSDIFVAGSARFWGNGYALVRGTAGFALIWSILYFLYRRKIFIKI
jgi:predicted acyltransferase